jgi:anhydro-N-acetylmuramic acid kinase
LKQHIDHLHRVAGQEKRTIIGLMSGTSLDGLDVALCEFAGSGTDTQLLLKQFKTVPYDDPFKEHIRTIFAKRQIDFQDLCLLNPLIGIRHGQIILECLRDWKIDPKQVDLIASHGQTVFHAPKKQHQLADFPNATLQIGDGDHIAVTTGITTLSDFRQKHIAAGGEGAPLAVYGDFFLFAKKNENRLLLNMGGIANFTLLPGNLNPDGIFTTDTGPGNTLIDAYMRRFFNKPYDEHGEVAAKGTVNAILLKALKDNPFFYSPFPKTTGPEVFSADYVEDTIRKANVTSLSGNDIIATLTRLSADTIVDAIRSATAPGEQYVIYASGGGAHNPVLMQAIREQLPEFSLLALEELGVSGDAKEAVLFAVLANETVAGTHTTFGVRDGVPGVTMGKVSFPG